MLQISNPYAVPGEFRKAQLHCHTTESDGRFRPEDLLRMYRDAGYSFVCITDHNRVTRCEELNGQDFVAIRGTEGVLEWLMDVHFKPVHFPYLDAGKTEQGFTNFYSTLRTGPDISHSRVIDGLRDLIVGGGVAALRITGHSLGSALATLLAIHVGFTAVVVVAVLLYAIAAAAADPFPFRGKVRMGVG